MEFAIISLLIILIAFVFIILIIKNDLNIEVAINKDLMERLSKALEELENFRKENNMLQDEIRKLPKTEKVTKPRGRKPGSTNKKKESK